MSIDTPAAQPAKANGAAKDLSIGRMLLDMGKITPEGADRVLALQSEQGLRFGEAAQQLGLASAGDVAQVLASQFDYPYVQASQSGFDPALVAALDPFGAQAEMLRALRGQLTVRWFAGKHKALAVVAVDASAAASALAANLAIVFAQQGQRTVLVDANMRAPRQQGLFNLPAGTGLSDALAGRAPQDGITPVAPFDKLSLLGAGPQPPNPLELLARTSFGELNETLARDFDVVLYDAPAFSSSADAYAIAARTRGVLLVVSRSVSRQADIREIRAQLLRAGIEVVGAVLVDI
ncbi:polysaccharide biosynthesis tyrosine autokinase [Massilia sp. DWR3-1-1]|uniref:polysaccharide biosynthesis tyrosine autokinase n=1 Tax=Massilia sp. DWR3-1-1 TaxID=2804559 RepID=UPI003CF3A5D5